MYIEVLFPDQRLFIVQSRVVKEHCMRELLEREKKGTIETYFLQYFKRDMTRKEIETWAANNMTWEDLKEHAVLWVRNDQYYIDNWENAMITAKEI